MSVAEHFVTHLLNNLNRDAKCCRVVGSVVRKGATEHSVTVSQFHWSVVSRSRNKLLTCCMRGVHVRGLGIRVNGFMYVVWAGGR